MKLFRPFLVVFANSVSVRPVYRQSMAFLIAASTITCTVFAAGRLDHALRPSAQQGSSRGSSVSGSITASTAGNNAAFVYLNQSPSTIATTNASLRLLLSVAFNLNSAQSRLISGAPDWIDSVHFDVQATVQGNPDIAQRKVLLQSLLADKLMLIVHHETKIVPVYALELSEPGKVGSQLRPHANDALCIDANAGQSRRDPLLPFCGGIRVWDDDADGTSHENGNKITMDTLAGFLSRDVDRPVLDRSGLRGFFDFDLAIDYIPRTVERLNPNNVSSAKEVSSLIKVLQTQLGLKLVSQNGPTNILVIDRVEKPAVNESERQ